MNLSDKLRSIADTLDTLEVKGLNDSNCIKIWRSQDCPKEIMSCFENHDDIDQIAFVPNSLKDCYFRFLTQPHFGCCEVTEHDIGIGIIVVGYHA